MINKLSLFILRLIIKKYESLFCLCITAFNLCRFKYKYILLRCENYYITEIRILTTHMNSQQWKYRLNYCLNYHKNSHHILYANMHFFFPFHLLLWFLNMWRVFIYTGFIHTCTHKRKIHFWGSYKKQKLYLMFIVSLEKEATYKK